MQRCNCCSSPQTSTSHPNNVLNAVVVALQMDTCQIISKLLQIFGMIPVIAATNERSFCALKVLKIFLRAAVGKELSPFTG